MRVLIKILNTFTPLKEEENDENVDLEESLMGKIHFTISAIPDYNNVLILIFDTLYAIVYKQREASSLTIIHINVLENFVFVDNLPNLLMSIFNSKGVISQKQEIHSEILYKRIFEQSDKFSS